MWHPASLLLSWLGFALLLAWVPLPFLLVLSGVCLILALTVAKVRTRRLLWRSRWLLLSLATLFLFFTPGEYLPGFWSNFGVTYEGIHQGAEQLGRLLAMLGSLALLHERVGTQGLLIGLHWLLRPLPWRETTVVRLMLVLEFVERQPADGWRAWLANAADNADDRECRNYRLAVPAMQWQDWLLLGIWLSAGIVWAVWR